MWDSSRTGVIVEILHPFLRERRNLTSYDGISQQIDLTKNENFDILQVYTENDFKRCMLWK